MASASLKSSAPLSERLLAEVAPLQLQQVEAVDARRHVPPVQECEEVGLAMTAGGNQFTVNDAGLRGEPEDSGGDRREAARKSPPFRP